MAKIRKEKRGIVDYPNKITFITGTTESVTRQYNDLMCNFTDVIVSTMMTGTSDNVVLAIIHHTPLSTSYF